MKKKLFAFTMVAVMAVSAAACGAKEEDASAPVTAKVIDVELTSEQYAFGVDKNQPELLEQANQFIADIQADGTFEEICDRYFGDGEPVAVESAEEDASKDQLVVATNAEFAPFEYMEGDKYYGIDMEIAKAFADSLGKELVIVNMSFDAVCLSVGQSKCDIAMAGLTITEDRKEAVNFTDSYYNAAQKIVVKSDNTEFDECKTADDVAAILNEKDNSTKIGFQAGTTAQFYCEGDADWGFDGYAVEGIGYDNGSLAVQDMLNGNLDYVIIDAAPAVAITTAINAMIAE